MNLHIMSTFFFPCGGSVSIFFTLSSSMGMTETTEMIRMGISSVDIRKQLKVMSITMHYAERRRWRTLEKSFPDFHQR